MPTRCNETSAEVSRTDTRKMASLFHIGVLFALVQTLGLSFRARNFGVSNIKDVGVMFWDFRVVRCCKDYCKASTFSWGY